MRPGPGTRLAGALLMPVLAAGAVLTGPAEPARAVANGQDAPPGRYDFAVKLTMTGLPTLDGGRRDSSCTGALIAPQWVITAGHCFKNAKGARVGRPVARRTTVTAGRADLSDTSAGRTATVTAVRQSATTDVALARISPPITDIAPIRLSRSSPSVGARVRLAGFGYTSDDDASSQPTRLQTGQFEVVSVSRPYVGMAGRAPSRDTSPCSRDSGGPYFSQPAGGPPVLVAVVSHGPDCPHTGADSGGRVDTIASWITGITGPVAAPVPSASAAARVAGPATAAPVARRADPPPATGTVMIAVAGLVGVGVPLLLLGGRRRRRALSHSAAHPQHWEGTTVRRHR